MQPQPAPLSVHLILLAAQLCFASLPVVGRLAVAHLPPGAIVVVRLTAGAVVFAAVAWRRGTLRFPRGDLGLIAVCAVLGSVINQEMFLHGLARSTATNAVVLGSTIPVFTALAAIASRREPVRLRRLAGIAVAFGGVAALVGADQLSTSPEHLLGSAMVLINAVSYGSYLVVVRPLAQRHDPIALLAFMFVIAAPLTAPLGVPELVAMPSFGAGELGFLAFLIAVPTVGAYGLTQLALQRAESSLVATYIYLQPVFATLGAWLVLDEAVGLRTLVCGGVVLGGVWLSARAR